MLNQCTAVCLGVFVLCFPRLGRSDGLDVASWTQALPGLEYNFPSDHAVHQGFKTEWWYFTGNLQDDRGRPYGFELTFFRQGVIPPPSDPSTEQAARSRFVQNDFKFAHFAISDIDGSKFVFTQKTSRGAFGEAGFGAAPPVRGQPERLAWIDDWNVQPLADGSWHVQAHADAPTPMLVDLQVTPRKSPVIEGVDGVSQKSAGVGNASHYYSFTRLQTTGHLALNGNAPAPVHGESWFDHEWASNQLAPDQVGWNWFCFQFDDQTELMLYAMRRRDGSVDPASSGTLVSANGSSEHLPRDQFTLRSVKSWHSQKTDANYPLEWEITIPSHSTTLTVKPRLDDQELVVPPISYWEGAIQAVGHKSGRAIAGLGYMELTGYAGELKGLQQQANSASSLRTPTH